MSGELVRQLADEVLATQSAFDPLTATMLGLPGYQDRLPDPSPAADQTLRERASALARQAASLDRRTLGPDDEVTAAVSLQQAQALIDRIDAGMVEYTITDNNYVGPAATMLTFMPVVSIAEPDDAEAYLERLRSVPAYLDAVIERHRAGGRAGRVPVRRLLDAAVAHLDRHLAAPQDDPLLRPTGAAAGERFAVERAALVQDLVRPALAGYRDVLAGELAGAARPDDQPGLCWLPGGEERYAALSRVHTTTNRTPDQLHELGLTVIASLREQYAELGSRLFGTTDQAEIFRRLADDPALRWADADELLAAARAAIERAEAALPGWFGILPQAPCEVRAVPATEAPGAPFAYYFQPSLDGSRAGIYYANTHRAPERDRYVSEVTAFHEAVPGHHLQLTIAVERRDLPLLRRLADVNAAVEGWALYAERLADEMGLYSNDLARLGMVGMDSMRAGRLVVDTGLHAKGWSRDQAIGYLRDNTPLSVMEVENEVDRYVAFAGQALAYMTGRVELLRMRARAQERLGPRFNLSGFHDVITGNGPLPLDVLDAVLARWAP